MKTYHYFAPHRRPQCSQDNTHICWVQRIFLRCKVDHRWLEININNKLHIKEMQDQFVQFFATFFKKKSAVQKVDSVWKELQEF